MGLWDDLDDDAYMQKNKNIKTVLMGLNVMLWICGMLLIILGSYSLSALKEVRDLVSVSLPAALIVLGVLFFILTNVGCYSTHKEYTGGLVLYTVFMILLLVCVIGVGGGLFKYRDEVADDFGKAWRRSDEDTRHHIEENFSCCGWNSTNDFPGSNCSNSTNTPLPNANEPCKEKIVKFAQKYMYFAAFSAIVIGILEFLSVLVAIFLVVRGNRNPAHSLLAMQNEKDAGTSTYCTNL